MFINDVHKKEEIQSLAINDLKTLGIKYRPKKTRQHNEETKSRKVFKRPLNSLASETVTLPSGQQLIVPKIVLELCSFILIKIDTEGLFRKGGSRNRQNEIKLGLDAGCYLGDEHHEIDVASVLKTFFRELPEPLIPYSYHELFLRCMLLQSGQVQAALLACLLLPTVHLNTLAYFMQFLNRVAQYNEFNKMDAYNLAVVIGPTLFPAEEKLPNNATLRLTKTCELFKCLIENAPQIGVLNESIIERIAHISSDDESIASNKKKKKRRSGSLTRMLSGLKKIVTHKNDDNAMITPDLLMTPCLTRSAKKRKVESVGISAKKRQEIIGNLPNNAILNMPFSPTSTPVNCHPDGNIKNHKQTIKSSKTQSVKEKRLLWSSKSKKKTTDSSSTSSIQRRWSAVSSVAGFKKKKTRNSCIGTLSAEKPITDKETRIDNQLNILNEEIITKVVECTEPDYVRIPKSEYEDIKCRVSEIERRISLELEHAPEIMPMPETAVEEVNKKYEETLVQAEPLCPTTDQLAKRLSRELKIRRSDEHRPVFRSPSARKIGSIRRKEGQKVRLSRTQTWCVTSVTTRNSIRRSKTASSTNNTEANVTNSPPVNSSTTSTLSMKSNTNSIITDSSGASWKSAQGFFNTPDVPKPVLDNNCRASLARLRSQNAGMVMAKARLFDNMGDSMEMQENDITRARSGKIGALRNQCNRVRTLRNEERRKKSMSPRKRPCKSPGIHRLPKADDGSSNFKDLNRMDFNYTPKRIPHIKPSLHTKSPRRLCKTPLSSIDNRQTPMKASRLNLE